MKLDIIIRSTDKGIRIPDLYKEAFQNLIKYCNTKRGGYMRLVLSPPFKHRSTGENSQNHAINGFIQQICMVTGNDFDDAKIYFKRSAFKRGYPFKTTIIDEKEVIVYSLNDGEPLPASEKEIDTIQAGYLIDEVKQFADEHSIKLEE